MFEHHKYGLLQYTALPQIVVCSDLIKTAWRVLDTGKNLHTHWFACHIQWGSVQETQKVLSWCWMINFATLYTFCSSYKQYALAHVWSNLTTSELWLHLWLIVWGHPKQCSEHWLISFNCSLQFDIECSIVILSKHHNNGASHMYSHFSSMTCFLSQQIK